VFNLSLVSVMIVCCVAVIAAIFWFRYWSLGSGHRDAAGNLDEERLVVVGGYPAGSSLASFMNAAQIQVLGYVYKIVAVWMTEKENHQTDTKYEDALITKVFLFQFCNSYSSLFYIAFVKSSAETCGDGGPGACLDELYLQLLIVFGTRLVTGTIMELGIPWAKAYWSRRQAMKHNDAKQLSAIEHQYALEEYGDDGLFEDYAEMSVQFGFATLFAPACPIAPVLALFSNYVKIRVGALQLCCNTRRPFPKGAADIGSWYTILSIMATVAVTTNAALLAFTSKLFRGDEATYGRLSRYSRVWIFLLFEHAVLILRFALETLIPEVPEVVEIQAARTERLVEKVMNLTPDEEADDRRRSHDQVFCARDLIWRQVS
jgi:hypothetical protein